MGRKAKQAKKRGPSFETLEGRTLMSVTVAPSGHDDTQAIVAAAQSTQPGQTVSFTSGNYQISSELNLPSDRTYVGNGATLNFNNGAYAYLGGGRTELSGFTFSRGGLDLQEGSFNIHDNSFTGIGGGEGILVGGNHDGHIDHNRFTNLSGSTGIYGYPGNNNTYDNNTFDYVFEPIHLTASADHQDVSYNTITHPSRIAIEIQNGMTNLTVEHNSIMQWVNPPGQSHMALSIATGDGNNIDIGNNVSVLDGVGTANMAFVEVFGTNVTVHDNYARHWGCFILDAVSNNLVSTNNTVIGIDGSNISGTPDSWDAVNGAIRPTIVNDHVYGANDPSAPQVPSGNTVSTPPVAVPPPAVTPPVVVPPVATVDPNAPKGLNATDRGNGQATLTWTDPTHGKGTPTLYVFATHGDNTPIKLGTLAAGATSATISGVNQNWEITALVSLTVNGTESALTGSNVQVTGGPVVATFAPSILQTTPPVVTPPVATPPVATPPVVNSPPPVVAGQTSAPRNVTNRSAGAGEVTVSWTDSTGGRGIPTIYIFPTRGNPTPIKLGALAAGTTSVTIKGITNNWEVTPEVSFTVGGVESSLVGSSIQVFGGPAKGTFAPTIAAKAQAKAEPTSSGASTSLTSVVAKTREASQPQSTSSNSAGSGTAKGAASSPAVSAPETAAGGGSSASTGNHGLRQVIFKSPHLRGKHLVSKAATVNVQWGGVAWGSSSASGAYSAQWKGKLLAPVTDNYTLTVKSGSNVRLYVDHRLVLDHWADSSAGTGSVTLRLQAGKHAIRLDYKQSAGNADVSLDWSTATMPEQVIPQSQLMAA